MNGQWLGTFSSSVGNGRVIVNVDERETNYEGIGYFVQDDKQLPSSAVAFKTSSKNHHFEMRSDWVMPIDPGSALIAPWEKVKSYYPEGIAFGTYADITGDWNADQLSVSWTTDLGGTGSCVLPRSKATEPSELLAASFDRRVHSN